MIKKLKKQFSKNELEYALIDRNDRVALFQLGPTKYPDGYEVCRIYKMRPHKAFGIDFDESEKISSNDQFLSDGSGSFRNLDNALEYFDKLSSRLVRKDDVCDLELSDDGLVAECQIVGDDGLQAQRT